MIIIRELLLALENREATRDMLLETIKQQKEMLLEKDKTIDEKNKMLMEKDKELKEAQKEFNCALSWLIPEVVEAHEEAQIQIMFVKLPSSF